MANKVTLKDLADKLGISQNTVSLALRGREGVSDATREAVKNLARELNYAFKKKDKTKNICVVATIASSNDTYYFSRFQNKLEHALRKLEFNIITINNIENYSARSLYDFCEANDIHGIISIGDVGENIISDIISLNIPAVCAGYYPPTLMIDSVLEDNIAGILVAVYELKKRGYTRFGFIGSINDDQGFFERFMALRAILKKEGLTRVHNSFITQYSYNELSSVDTLKEILLQINDLPEVFVCANDKIAMAAIKVLQELNLNCPNDIGIIGFDNCDLAKLTTPSLATIDNFMDEQVNTAVLRINKRMDNPCMSVQKILIPAVFIDGESLRTQS